MSDVDFKDIATAAAVIGAAALTGGAALGAFGAGAGAGTAGAAGATGTAAAAGGAAAAEGAALAAAGGTQLAGYGGAAAAGGAAGASAAAPTIAGLTAGQLTTAGLTATTLGRARLRTIEEQRIRSAQTQVAGVGAGIGTESSPVRGTVASLASQAAGNIGLQQTMAAGERSIFAAEQTAARAGGRADLFGQAAQLGADLGGYAPVRNLFGA
jgi:hypothetical protein